MPSIFSKIIAGDIPGRIVWSDDTCVAMVDIRPLNEGHTLVIPREEVDQWVDLDQATAQHLMGVAKAIGEAQRRVVDCERIGLMIAGFEVPHTHLHVVPISNMSHLDFASANQNVDPAALDDLADRLRAALVAGGYSDKVPA